MSEEVLVVVVTGDGARSARWCAAWLARWAAERIYAADSERAKTHSEKWGSLISESIPSDILALRASAPTRAA